MVAAYALFTHPFPSSHSYPAHTSLATSLSHECLPLLKLTRTRFGFSSLTQLGVRPNERFLPQCSTSSISDSDTVFSLLQAFGIDEKEAQLILAKNPALGSLSLDSLRARIASFNSVGLDGLVLSNLINKCPDLLTALEVDPFLNYVAHDLGAGAKIEPPQLRRLFRYADLRFLAGFDQKVELLRLRGVPVDKIGYVLNKVNLYKALCLKSVEDIDEMIVFLNRFGGIGLIVRLPVLLNYDLEAQVVPRIEFLMEVCGGDEAATATLLGKLPQILSYTVDHVRGHVEILRSLAGLSDEQIHKFMLVFPNVVSASIERKLRPRIGFLKKCGLSSNDIFKFLIRAPLFLGVSFKDNIAPKLVFLVKLGYKYRTREFAAVLGSVTRTTPDNLQSVIELFLSYGFSCADIVVMSKRHPQVLQYNHASLEKKLEYLINYMGRDIDELLAFPTFLGYKLDERIKARYEVKRKILGDGMSLNKLLCVSSESFKPKTPAYVIDLNVE